MPVQRFVIPFVTIALLLEFVSADIAKAGILMSYDFTSDLSDTLGNGNDLTASGGTVSGGRYSFAANQGLRLTDALPSTTDYGIEFRFQGTDSFAGWNKLLDFQDLTTDSGLYVLGGGLNAIFTTATTAGSIPLNTDVTVGMARSGGAIQFFLDGALLFTQLDGSNRGVQGANILNFFEDDFATGQVESFAGSVDWIRIHDDSSTFGTEPSSVVPEASTFAIWSLLGMTCVGATYFQRRRKAA